MPNETKRLLSEKGKIKMRLYGQGLGDCFLLAFPRTDNPDNDNPCYLVIDCGAAKSTPNRAERMKNVVKNIRDATGGRVDVLAVTHQHFDHISGFQDAWEEWKQIEIGAIYLPWTERHARDGEFKSSTRFRDALERASKKILERVGGNELLLKAYPGLQAQADFLGVGAVPSTVGTPAQETIPEDMDSTMAFVRERCPIPPHYFEPGDVFRLPGTDFHGYVLGPPLKDTAYMKDGKERKYIELLSDHTKGVMYDYEPLGMEVDAGKPGGGQALRISDDHGLPALASGILAAGALGDAKQRDEDEPFCPFAPEIRLDWENALSAPFFQTHYDDKAGVDGKWRRVDYEWLSGAANLALRAGDYTNNLSLVLAFDKPAPDPAMPESDSDDSKDMLLFPGDAQVGNWLSWHTIEGWRFTGDAAPGNAPEKSEKKSLMENLLARVAFYKVGHHGSHNATVKDQGLELMTNPKLMAYIPVSVLVAQDKMNYCPMPFYPVLRALQQKTQGRVFLPNGKCVEPGGNSKLPAGVSASAETLDTVPTPAKPEGDVPLYLEVTI